MKRIRLFIKCIFYAFKILLKGDDFVPKLVELYVDLINLELRTLETTPAIIRQQVKIALEKQENIEA